MAVSEQSRIDALKRPVGALPTLLTVLFLLGWVLPIAVLLLVGPLVLCAKMLLWVFG